MRLSVLLSLFLPPFAFADEATYLHHCAGQKLTLPAASVAAAQVKDMKRYVHARLLSELDDSIRARKALLACLALASDQACLAQATDPDCPARVQSLRGALEKNLHRLRFALALSPIPTDLNDRSVGKHIALPAALGGAELSPLTDAELEQATRFQKSALAAAERVGAAKLIHELSLDETPDKLAEKCRRADPDLLEVCERLKGNHLEALRRFRQAMGKVANSVISSLPLTVRFHASPITDSQLRNELGETLQSFTAWRKDAAADEGDGIDQLYLHGTFTDEYVAKHPEACASAEATLREAGHEVAIQGAVKNARSIAIMGLTCAVTTPAVCFTAGAGFTYLGLRSSYLSWDDARTRFSAGDAADASNLTGVNRKFRDFLLATALSSAGTLSGINGLAQAQSESISAMTQSIEAQSPVFFRSAGDAFDNLAGTFYGQVTGSLQNNAILSGARAVLDPDPATKFEDWLGSDAFAARVYGFFELEIGQG